MRKKKELKRIENWFFGSFGLPRIKIIYANAPALIDPDGNTCFGCYVWGDGEHTIWISYGMGKWGLLQTIFHELAHYMQDCQIGLDKYGEQDAEAEAVKMQYQLLSMWMQRKRNKKRRHFKHECILSQDIIDFLRVYEEELRNEAAQALL